MKLDLAAGLIYWAVIAFRLAPLVMVAVHFVRSRPMVGTKWLLLAVIGIDTCSTIIENAFLGLWFNTQLELFESGSIAGLSYPPYLVVAKQLNIVGGCFVLALIVLGLLKTGREYNDSGRLVAELAALTGSGSHAVPFNQQHWENLAHAEWARFQRYGRPLSLLVVDIDGLKSINDYHGFSAGDVVLKAVADSCASAKRETDIVARVGGDQFCLLLPETNESSAMIVAERLRFQIQNHSHAFGDEELRATVSIGVVGAALRMPTFSLLLQSAKDALAHAKLAGRNQVMRAPIKGDETERLSASAIPIITAEPNGKKLEHAS